MPNEGTGNDAFLSELDIRIWMRDNNPEANILLQDYEFTPEEIRTCMTLAVDKWNETPPAMARHSHTIADFPYRGELLRGTCGNLLFAAAMRFRRNELQASVPGGVVSDQSKYNQYDAAGERLWREFVSWIHMKKRAINMEEGWVLIS
jgi:hypothetical protein